ncbi:MAG: integrin alpha [Candidatus Sumerlaeota bacterium]|nr:integrin alpha [Candidatus Sumerlaeota bacterium]
MSNLRSDRKSGEKFFGKQLIRILSGSSLIAASATLLIILAGATSSIQAAQEKGAFPDGASKDWSSQAQQAVAAQEYEVTAVNQASASGAGAAYQAPNRSQGLRTNFTAQGPRVVPRTQEASWTWGLELTGFTAPHDPASAVGTQSACVPPAVEKISPNGNRIEYHRGAGLIEWYVNDPKGLEQGFTITDCGLRIADSENPYAAIQSATNNPQSAKKESAIRNPQSAIIIDLAIRGDLAPKMTPGGRTIEFRNADGAMVLCYGGLKTTDATGKELPSRMELTVSDGIRNAPHDSALTQSSIVNRQSSIHIMVDAANAAYPITVDPTITAPNWSVDGEQASGGLGWALGPAGDVNGDGYADVLITAHGYDTGVAGGGRVFLYYGSSTGLASTPGWIANGSEADYALGRGATTAGDVNGDGYSDVMISSGAYIWGDDSTPIKGRVHIWYGSPTGPKANATPANADWMVEGAQVGEVFGFSCAAAGDINKDGYGDVIISSPYYDTSYANEGKIYVYCGSPTGLATSPAWTVQGDQSNAHFGFSVSGAGDVNGDGYPDIIVGAPDYDNGQLDAGRAYVFYGSASGLPATASKIYNGDQASGYFGWSVACAGDVNKDGYSDVIISAVNYDNGQLDEGRVYGYYGSAAGLPAAASWMVESNQEGANLGTCVSSAGDFNGDGYSDVLVGAYRANSYEGEAFVFFGSPSGLAATGTVIPNPEHVGSRFGWRVAGVGDVNHDGADDVIVGAFCYPAGGLINAGRAYAYYGAGPAKPSETLEIVSVTQTPEKNVDIVYTLTPPDPAPANGYDVSTLAIATGLDCAVTSGTPDSAFDDISSYVTGDTHITSGSGLLTWNVKGMPAGALKNKYWKAGVSVLFRLKAIPKN